MIIEFDSDKGEYFVIYDFPTVVSTGKSLKNVLNDIRKAAHFCIEAALTKKIKNIKQDDPSQ